MEQMTCPSCGGPLTNNYCVICNAYPPEQREDDFASEWEIEDASEALPYDSEGAGSDSFGCDMRRESNQRDCQPQEASRVTCRNCGMEGEPAKECPQCGSMLPSASVPPQSAGEPLVRCATAVFPNGQRVQLPDGVDYHLGRESGAPEVCSALSDREYVSRRHCTLRLDAHNRQIAIRDDGSTNGTFVGEERQRVEGWITRSVPVVVWLGSYVKITIEV